MKMLMQLEELAAILYPHKRGHTVASTHLKVIRNIQFKTSPEEKLLMDPLKMLGHAECLN